MKTASLAAITSISLTSIATATVVVFENPTHLPLLNTQLITPFGEQLRPPTFFDPTVAPGAQPLAASSHTTQSRELSFAFGQEVRLTTMSSSTPGGVAIARSAVPVTLLPFAGFPPYTTIQVVADMRGLTIGPGADWAGTVDVGAVGSPTESLISAGQVIGLRIPVPGGFNYGFVEFDSTNFRIPIRYGYETEVNLPLQVPAPGAIAGIGVAAALGLRRQRERRAIP